MPTSGCKIYRINWNKRGKRDETGRNHGVRNVYHGVRKVNHDVRKVYHGLRKVYHVVRKVLRISAS